MIKLFLGPSWQLGGWKIWQHQGSQQNDQKDKEYGDYVSGNRFFLVKYTVKLPNLEHPKNCFFFKWPKSCALTKKIQTIEYDEGDFKKKEGFRSLSVDSPVS